MVCLLLLLRPLKMVYDLCCIHARWKQFLCSMQHDPPTAPLQAEELPLVSGWFLLFVKSTASDTSCQGRTLTWAIKCLCWQLLHLRKSFDSRVGASLNMEHSRSDQVNNLEQL